MGYKVVYLEDQEAGSVISDLQQYDFDVVHCKPANFEGTLKEIEANSPDLILMDFRLTETGGHIDAPSFAQYFRSHAIDVQNEPLPVVLLSNDHVIRRLYNRDYTSHDLFDFFINKHRFTTEPKKYASLMKGLIESYRKIKKTQNKSGQISELLIIPTKIENRIDPRIFDQLSNSKNSTDVFSASSFILDQIVKPIGVLIGEDVLAARLGIDQKSEDWGSLISNINEFKYTGIFSVAYKRWWSAGLELWWEDKFPEFSSLRRLTARERCEAIQKRLDLQGVLPIDGDGGTRFWTICKDTFKPLDSSNGYEPKSENIRPPWLEQEYYSYEAILDIPDPSILKDVELARFRAKAEGA